MHSNLVVSTGCPEKTAVSLFDLRCTYRYFAAAAAAAVITLIIVVFFYVVVITSIGVVHPPIDINTRTQTLLPIVGVYTVLVVYSYTA